MRRPGRLGSLCLLLAIVSLATFAVRWHRSRAPAIPSLEGLTPEATRRLLRDLDALDARERRVEEATWAPETLARRCGRLVDEWWDALNTSPSPLLALRDAPVPQVRWPEWTPPEPIGHGLSVRQPAGDGPELDQPGWQQRLAKFAAAGWRLARVELRHNAFATNQIGGPDHSTYGFIGWFEQTNTAHRVVLQGNLTLHWAPTPDADGRFPLTRLDASGLTLAERTGPPSFIEEFTEVVAPPEKSHFIDPLLIHDLDGDDRPEIVLAAKNRVYRRQPHGRYTTADLCRQPPGLIFTGVLADFNGDGAADFLCARFEGLVLFRGSPKGDFADAGSPAWTAEPRLRYGQVLTCGDVDGDGDLDVWLGQYKPPYERGQMPTPYHDANDGNPSWLLLNDGQGRFRDATAAAGLAARRHRRTYSASFVDLNDDGAVDLLVVSDFAGVDLHLNDGRGRFRDARSWFPDPLGFGMAHSLADFDGDGRLDLFMTGMHCPTASRLESLRLQRPGFEALDAFRGRMTQGNRLYLGRPDGFVRSPLNPSVARSGWSWSCPAADFDNDGWTDVYIANGHETRQSVADYDTEFWLRDIYLADSHEDLAKAAYFGAKFGRTRGQGMSYGGYEANRLFLNDRARRFVEVGWLLGVAVEQDSRNAVAADLDGDGRQDLAVTTFEAWPERRQTLRIFHNQIPASGHWIGVQLDFPGAGISAIGARVILETSTRRFVHAVVTGDSHRTQSAPTPHFGLGTIDAVQRLEVQWPGGRRTVLTAPAVDRWHRLSP